MLENSLKIREKYINKIKTKVNSLSDSIHLLEKVDRQLIKTQLQIGGAKLNSLMKSYNDLQSGGANVTPSANKSVSPIDFKAIQESALQKKTEILLKTKDIQQLNDNIKKLSEGFRPINEVLQNVKALIDSIKIDLPELKQGTAPSIGDWHPLAQYNLFHNKTWKDIVFVNNLADAANKIDFNVFDKTPDENKARLATVDERKIIEDYLKAKIGAENVTNIASMYCAALDIVQVNNTNKAKCNLEEVNQLSATPSAPLPEDEAAKKAKAAFNSGNDDAGYISNSRPANSNKYRFF